MASRILIVIGALVLVVPLALCAIYRPDRAIRTATAAVADVVCAKTFVSGLDPDAVFAETLGRPGIRRLRHLLRHRLDRTVKTVDVSVMGSLAAHSAFHDGFGCVLMHGAAAPYLLKNDIEALQVSKSPPLLPDIAGPAPVEPTDPALTTALDHAFEEPAEPPYRRTKAVVIVHDGKVIAERYATGIGVDTPLIGFSMTKSVINALLGIMTQQGLTSPSLPAPVAEWRTASDPRREIEMEHLMRMTSGLALDETNSGFDPSSQMYLYGDMAGFAVNMSHAQRIEQFAPGKGQRLLGAADSVADDPRQNLRHVTLEFDARGTLQGSANMLASARDWAKLGLLYLDDGVVGDKRILHEDWVSFSAAATLDTDYGAGFWTNRSEHPNARGRVRAGMPRDSFFASGTLGQRIVILPSQHMVVVRLGDSVAEDGDIRGLTRLVREVIAATEQR